MALLHWRRGGSGAILLGGSVRTGKEVELTGEQYEGRLPKTFSVIRQYGALLSRYRRRHGLPPTTSVGTLAAIADGLDAVRSGPLALPTPGRRLKWRLFFEDDLRNRSPELHVSRLGIFDAKVGVAVEPGKAEIKTKFTAAVDPLVEPSLLTPWSEDFDDYVRELSLGASDGGEESLDEFSQLREFLSPFTPAEPPEGFEAILRPGRLELDEGESTPVEASISLPAGGTMVFALQMAGEVDGELLRSATDPMVLHVPDDGGPPAFLFGDSGSPAGDLGVEPERSSAPDLELAGEPVRA